MFTAGIVELTRFAGQENAYRLPPEHADFLTTEGKAGNLAVYTQEIPLLTTCSMEKLIGTFASGEGIPFDCYPRFQAFRITSYNVCYTKLLRD